MRFASKSGSGITIEELDEALAIEDKHGSDIDTATRLHNSTLIKMKDSKRFFKWRSLMDFPVKVSSTKIYIGVAEKLNGDEIRVRLSGVPPKMKRAEIIEWLSGYGTVKSHLKVRKIKGNDGLLNVDGLVDRTTVDVVMELERDFREKEIVKDSAINIGCNNKPNTCWNCNKPWYACE